MLVNTPKGKNFFENIKNQVDIISCNLQDSLIKQENLIKPTTRKTNRDNFYNNLQNDDFIYNLEVGLSLKERIKTILPRPVIEKFKKL